MRKGHLCRILLLASFALITTMFTKGQKAYADAVPVSTYLKTGVSENGSVAHNVTWDSEEHCAVFNGNASYIEIQNPFTGADSNTGFTVIFDAYISSDNNNSGTYERTNGLSANKSGWQRLFEVNNGETGSKMKYFDLNAGTAGPLTIELAAKGSSDKATVKLDDSSLSYFDAWHNFCLVVSPGGYMTLYMDDTPISWSPANSKAKDIIDIMGSFSKCYIGASGYEIGLSNKDGFFIGKMKNLEFYAESAKGAYTGESTAFRLDYDTKGGEPIDSVTVEAIPSAGELPVPVKAGAEFLGWFTDAAYTKAVVPGTPLTSNVVLYAAWHAHDLKLQKIGSFLVVSCLSTENPCELHNNSLVTGIDIDAAACTNDYLSIRNSADLTAHGFTVTVTYSDRDNPGAAPTSTKPTEEGRYIASLTLTIAPGVSKELTRTFIINEDKEVVPGAAEPDAMSGRDFPELNRGGGEIYYGERSHTIVYSNEAQSSYIDLTEEKLYTDLPVAYYTLDGKSWKAGDIDTINTQLSKKMSSGFTLKIAAGSLDTKTKKPASDAQVRTFAKIGKRAATEKFTVNYYLCRDCYGITNGQWCLTKTKSNVVQTLSGYEIGVCDDGKTIGAKGYGIWPEAGGVWIADLKENGKAGKQVYLYRKIASGTTPAGKSVKVTVSTVQPATKLKVDYKKESIKLRKEMNIYFGSSLPVYDTVNGISVPLADIESTSYYGYYAHALLCISDSQAKKALNLTPYITDSRNSIIVWQTATAKKPASAPQTIVLAARKGVPTAEECVTFQKGTAKLAKGYEVYDEKTKKWKTSLPKAGKTDVTVIVRFKANAKGGSENDTTYANGREGLLTLHYGVFDETLTKNNTGFVSGTIVAK